MPSRFPATLTPPRLKSSVLTTPVLKSLVLKSLVLGCATLYSLAALADGVSDKRGIAFAAIQPADRATMNGNVAWWYNWSPATDPNLEASAEAESALEFVPMTFGADFDEQRLRGYLDEHAEARYLLAFNEPNFRDQANLTPQAAANAWPRLEAIADDYGLKLLSPAVNYSPGEVDIPGTDDNGSPFAYLDAFFAACAGCRVDGIAVHAYMAAPEWFTPYIEQFHERYAKPIWVTEWNQSSDGGSTTRESQMDFLAETVRWMEGQDYIERYAWFLGRVPDDDDAPPTVIDLLDDDGDWTALGTLYQGIQGSDTYTTLPATIQAEHAVTMTGMHHRTTVDSDGRPVVQLFSNQDEREQRLRFQISSESDRTYRVRLAYAAGAASVRLRVDGQTRQTLSLPSTGSVYVWSQTTASLALSAGEHTLTLETTGGYPSFDWLAFE
ncbi:glycosyl hydrolase [Salinicola halophilus]|uniref:glycosyl hydrolase n=1 Tax=Salinicola halophilus TaxID=184065 RepID=UPI000DA13982|nr:glycosyl hydrolase [Salinicola halophilus]